MTDRIVHTHQAIVGAAADVVAVATPSPHSNALGQSAH